ncbi:MAG: hypothetical protein ACPG41_02360 [Lacinutrix venerupis]
MKQNFFKLTLLFLIAISAYNCQNDDDIINLDKTTKNNITVEHISSKKLDTRTAIKITEKVKQIQKNKELTLNSQNKFVYNNDFGVYIDLDNGKLINNNGKLYYTYPMYRNNEEKLENIVFTVLDNGEVETFFVKYNITPKQFDELSTIEQQNLTPQFQKVDANGNPEYICVDFIQTIIVYGQCEIEHSNGLTCDGEISTYVTSFCNWTSGSSNNTGNPTTNNTNNTNTSNNNYGNGYTNGSNSVTTTPISPTAMLIFELSNALNLTPEMTAWLEIKTNWAKGQYIKKFLEEQGGCFLLDIQGNTTSPECQQAASIAEAILILMMNDTGLTFEDAIILYVFGEQVEIIVEGPDTPIENMSQYLDCFDTSQSGQDAKITIYVDEPVDGSNALVGADGVGHTFISIEQGENIATFGFYPVYGLPSLYYSVDGIMGNNSNTTYDVSITIDNVSTTDFNNGEFTYPLLSIINHIIAFSNSNYDINGQNCTDLGIDIANLAGLPMPTCNANPIYFFGSTPGRAGEYIRNLTPLPEGVTKDTDGGVSPDNNCN